MVMLSTPFDERASLETQFGYDTSGSERLSHADVTAYHFTDKLVQPSEVSPEFGIEVKSIDEAINRLNESNSAIYFALADALHPLAVPEKVVEG